MTGAFRIARVFNIPVRVHWSFFVLVLGYVLYAGYDTDWDKIAMLWSGIFVLVLFFLVVLHEFGHALTARRYGVNTRDIILLPIGGVARLDHLPEKPAHEFWVAIAGPLVNVALAILFSLYLFRFTPDQRWEIMNGVVFAKGNFFLSDYSNFDRFIFFMAWLNVILATFNLIPAFPMDGGRILRALLSIGLGRLNATMIAARIGQLLALGMIAGGIWQSNPMYALIGLFILFTAENEYRSVRMESMVGKLKVDQLMRGNFSRVYLDDSIQQVLNIYTEGLEKNFLVFDQWQNLMGVLPEFKLLDARKKKDLQAPVSKYMLPEIYPLVSAENLRQAFGILQVSDVGAMPVYNPWNRLVGVLDEHHFSQDLKKRMKGRKWFGKD
jgi:Zn-dependent protease